jgi:DNA replication licensing factor MCM5
MINARLWLLSGNNIGEEACPLDPFSVLPERSKYTDTQVLKLQENPEDVPVGEMPRNLMLSVDRTLVQRIVPGTRVTVLGIYSIFQQRDKNAGKASVAIRQTYIRVVGLEEDADGNARGNVNFSIEEENMFKRFAAQPNVIAEVYKKIAPAIFGTEDIKSATACLLFGGARKQLPDGVRDVALTNQFMYDRIECFSIDCIALLVSCIISVPSRSTIRVRGTVVAF